MRSKIVRRAEHGGGWWAQWSDGTWTRWEPAEVRWIPEDPPVALAAEPSPETAAASVRPSAQNPVVAWWNANFPRHSVARLVFEGAWATVLVILVAFLRRWQGAPVPVPLTASVIVLTWVALAVGWTLARKDPLPSNPERSLRPSLVRDFLQSAPISIVGMVVIVVAMLGGDVSAGVVGTALAAGVLFSLTIVLRHTIFVAVVVSILGGFVLAAAQVVVSLMTWSEPWNFGLVWVVSSVILFALAAPAQWLSRWTGFSRFAPTRSARSVELPAWLLTAIGIVPVALLAVLAGAGGLG